MSNGPTPEELQPENLFRRPDHYLLEFQAQNAVFVRMTHETYRRSIFTDRRRIVAASPEPWGAPAQNLLEQYEAHGIAQPQLGYIFHVAHCGSTLLARALDCSQRMLVYREPFPLRQLAAEFTALPYGGNELESWSRRLKLVTGMLGRTFEPSQSAVIKANVPVNFILPQLMALNSDSRAIVLYAPLQGYLLSVLKSPQHQSWVCNVVRELAGGIRRIEPLADVVPEELSPPEAGACLWLAQMLSYRKLLASTDHVRSLNCEILFERAADTLDAAFAFYGLPLSPEEIGKIVSSDLFSHHAKAPNYRFDNAARKAELEKLADTLGEQIKDGMRWLSGLMPLEDLPETLPSPLVG